MSHHTICFQLSLHNNVRNSLKILEVLSQEDAPCRVRKKYVYSALYLVDLQTLLSTALRHEKQQFELRRLKFDCYPSPRLSIWTSAKRSPTPPSAHCIRSASYFVQGFAISIIIIWPAEAQTDVYQYPKYKIYIVLCHVTTIQLVIMITFVSHNMYMERSYNDHEVCSRTGTIITNTSWYYTIWALLRVLC